MRAATQRGPGAGIVSREPRLEQLIKPHSRLSLEPNSCPGGHKGFTTGLMDWGVQNNQVSPGKAGTPGERTANSGKVQRHHQCSLNRATKSQNRVLAIL